MEPLGTPQLLCFACDKWLFTLHFWFRLLNKYNLIHFNEFPLISQSLRNRLNVIVDVVKRLFKSLNIIPLNKPLLIFTDQRMVASRDH